MPETQALSPVATLVRLLNTPLRELPTILNTPITQLPIVLNVSPAERARVTRARAMEKVSSSGKVKQFVLEGMLQAGSKTKFAIGDEDIIITKGTWVFGDLEFVTHVTAHGQIRDRGERHVARIVVNDQDSQ